MEDSVKKKVTLDEYIKSRPVWVNVIDVIFFIVGGKLLGWLPFGIAMGVAFPVSMRFEGVKALAIFYATSLVIGIILGVAFYLVLSMFVEI